MTVITREILREWIAEIIKKNQESAPHSGYTPQQWRTLAAIEIVEMFEKDYKI